MPPAAECKMAFCARLALSQHNALPQRARATVNCRILPSESIDEVQRTLVRVLADDAIKVSRIGEGVTSPAPPLTPTLMNAVQDISKDMWPGVPVIPTMATGGTDGRFLNNAGIWTYGVSGMFAGAEPSGAHGLNEHLRVKSLYDGPLPAGQQQRDWAGVDESGRRVASGIYYLRLRAEGRSLVKKVLLIRR